MKSLLKISSGFKFSIQAYSQDRTEIGQGWNQIRLHDEYWRLYCNRQPGVTLVSETVRLPIRPGRLVIVPPRFQGRGMIEGKVDHFYAHFDVAGLPHGLAPFLFPAPLEVPRTPQTAILLDGWLEELGRPDAGDGLPGLLKAEALAAQALAVCWEARGLSQHPAWKAWMNRSPQMAQLETWMETRLAEDLSVARLAAKAGYTPDHFRRLFLRVFGMNPAAYVAQLRIKEAARLLLFHCSSIEAIAEQTGFSDRHHFTRVFRDWTGEAPAAYRKRNLLYLQ